MQREVLNMAYGSISLEKRLKENVKGYHLRHLFQMSELQEYLKCIATTASVDMLLTERHGEKAVAIGDFGGYKPNVIEEPGRKIRVAGRTVGHLYVRNENERPDKKENAEELLNAVVIQLSSQAEEVYKHKEMAQYAYEIESELMGKRNHMAYGEREDALTGAYNSTYFENRLKVIDRSGIVPVAVICGNINDWKYVNDRYGDEESDRLISTIASIIKKEAKPEYVIGRTDGDVFYILVPMVEDGEAESYCARIQNQCQLIVDDKIAPSIAFGCVIKTNVEENLVELCSDAEYEMLTNKFQMKDSAGYKKRLEKV